MDQRYVKSAAGHDEIKTKARQLPRGARNLLLLIDAGKSGIEWVGLINGATEADLQHLITEGLVDAVVPAQPLSGVAALAQRRERTNAAVQQALAGRSYQELYDLLTHQAKERFGLIKGYKLVLEVERCPDVPSLQALALRFVDMAQETQGDAGARAMRVALGSQI